MKLVTWPSWKQVRATTGVVLAAVFAFGAYFFLVDNIIGKAGPAGLRYLYQVRFPFQ